MDDKKVNGGLHCRKLELQLPDKTAIASISASLNSNQAHYFSAVVYNSNCTRMKSIVVFIPLVLTLVFILLARAEEGSERDVERYKREEKGQRYWPAYPHMCCGAMSVNATTSWLLWLLVAGVGMLVLKFNNRTWLD